MMSSFGDLIWRQRSARKAGSSSRQFVYSFSDAADEAARLVFGKAKWVRLAKNIRYEVDITTHVNGPLMNPVQLDTTTVATDTISYVATDQGASPPPAQQLSSSKLPLSSPWTPRQAPVPRRDSFLGNPAAGLMGK
jgi:hypothetical protein